MSKPKASRLAFGETLLEHGGQHKGVVVLDADLAKSTMSGLFAEKYPSRFFEMGIQEANMIGTAAGLALGGFTPFICSFACFVTGRFDTIRMSISYARAGVRVVGTHCGVGIGEDGHSQMGLEDLGLMRSLPEMRVFQPCDEEETKQMVQYLMKGEGGPAYIRLTRQGLRPIHDSNYKWELGKVDVLKRGESLALFATGATVQECLDAAESLKSKGVDPTVVNVHSLSPVDHKGIAAIVAEHDRVVTVEDHYTVGGLGSVVAEVMAEEGSATKLKRIGVETFGESGKGKDLYERYGLSAAKITETISRLN